LNELARKFQKTTKLRENEFPMPFSSKGIRGLAYLA
jgi:hypothetical protein